MLYGIVYVYRLSDFLDIGKAYSARRIFLNSLWLKERHPENPACSAGGFFKWTDVHELSFMGPFGMGYKMLIDGKTVEGKSTGTGFLTTNASLLSMHVEASSIRTGKSGRKQVKVISGMLVGTHPHRYARIPWELFMENQMPKKMPVADMTD